MLSGCRRHISTLRLWKPQQKRTFLAFSLALPGKTCSFNTSARCSLWRTGVLAVAKDPPPDSAGMTGPTALGSGGGGEDGSVKAVDAAAVLSSGGDEGGGKAEKGDGKSKKILKGEGWFCLFFLFFFFSPSSLFLSVLLSLLCPSASPSPSH